MTDFLNKAPYLRSQRQFPNDDLKSLSNQTDHAYIDIAQKVNQRIIGTYATNFQVITGEGWFFDGSHNLRQSLRQVYTFTAAGNIPHEINWPGLYAVSPRSYGTYTDGTNWYGVIYGTSGGAIPGTVEFYVTPTDIVVQNAGAPAIVSGFIDLEWISQF